jgi:hypothetical protein
MANKIKYNLDISFKLRKAKFITEQVVKQS